jgi:hypothetical protein
MNPKPLSVSRLIVPSAIALSPEKSSRIRSTESRALVLMRRR